MSSAAASSRWSELHPELAAEIFSLLELVDFIRATAVCKSWRQLKSTSKPKDQTPWLMLSSFSPSRGQFRYLCTPPSLGGKIKCRYRIHLPEIAGRRCVGSSEGFIIALDKFANLRAINPITGAHIPLPPTSTVPGICDVVPDPITGEITAYLVADREDPARPPCPWRLRTMRASWFRKAILSPPPPGPLPRTAVAISATGLAFARVGGGRWDGVAGSLSGGGNIDDILFHMGRLHAVHATTGALAVYDLEDRSPPSLVCDGLPWDPRPRAERFYLVESPPPTGGDLFLIARNLDFSHFPDDKDADPVEEWEFQSDDAFLDYRRFEGTFLHLVTRTTSFEVYKLDRDGRQWIRVNSLGDLSLFLGSSCSMALSAGDFPGLKRNCIYFTDDNRDAAFPSPRARRDMGIFDVGDARVQPLNLSDDLLQLIKWPPPIWITPRLS